MEAGTDLRIQETIGVAATAWGQADSHEGGIVSNPCIDPSTGPSPMPKSTKQRHIPAR
jgi:hypothetical protein